ncbi:hypothetical protein E1A91_A13G117100v1 [Gossypium mustelinum]|uniref:Uncharacterized protein n=1 Tax=Gossypium mustelinum TaxID=34275 RepID=A0A5D2WGE3_GOSMU|nr:hypothetical protein E1A91_A13G117100v1 [Gossypium mustelinum]
MSPFFYARFYPHSILEIPYCFLLKVFPKSLKVSSLKLSNISSTRIIPVIICSEDGILAVIEQGQERFRSLIPSYIRDSSVAVIVYVVATSPS